MVPQGLPLVQACGEQLGQGRLRAVNTKATLEFLQFFRVEVGRVGPQPLSHKGLFWRERVVWELGWLGDALDPEPTNSDADRCDAQMASHVCRRGYKLQQQY